MKKIHYEPTGICATAIDVVLNDDDTVESVVFTGGCPGNHLGIAALVKGMKREDVVKRLSGILCGRDALVTTKSQGRDALATPP